MIKHILLALLLAATPVTAQTVFADGFEKATTSCDSVSKVELGDGKGAVLIKPGTQSCLTGTVYTTNCIMEGSDCKRQQIPGPAPGFQVKELTWSTIFCGAKWPNSPSWLCPIGSWTLRSTFSTCTPTGNCRQGPPIAGLVLTTSFIADNAPHRISWVGVQPIPAAGYGTPNGAAAVTVTISEVKGDMYSKCSANLRSGALFYGPTASMAECRTVAGRQYWLSFHYAQPTFSTVTNTCLPNNISNGIRCDSNFSAR